MREDRLRDRDWETEVLYLPPTNKLSATHTVLSSRLALLTEAPSQTTCWNVLDDLPSVTPVLPATLIITALLSSLADTLFNTEYDLVLLGITKKIEVAAVPIDPLIPKKADRD